jgi:hypothetical protein
MEEAGQGQVEVEPENVARRHMIKGDVFKFVIFNAVQLYHTFITKAKEKAKELTKYSLQNCNDKSPNTNPGIVSHQICMDKKTYDKYMKLESSAVFGP